MSTRRYRNVTREASPQERSSGKALARRIDRDEAAEIKALGRAVKSRGDQLRNIFTRLKTERQKQGLSLSQVAARCGIDKSRLSRLENATHPNVTFDTVTRYAEAIGKAIRFQLQNRPIQHA